MWIQQESLGSTRSGAITPRRKDPVPGNNAASEVRQIMEGRIFGSHDHICK
jgi:hypothetical protein